MLWARHGPGRIPPPTTTHRSCLDLARLLSPKGSLSARHSFLWTTKRQLSTPPPKLFSYPAPKSTSPSGSDRSVDTGSVLRDEPTAGRGGQSYDGREDRESISNTDTSISNDDRDSNGNREKDFDGNNNSGDFRARTHDNDRPFSPPSFQRPSRFNRPTNFRDIPHTEYIEGLDSAAATDLLLKRPGRGAFSIFNHAFSIKACRMPYRETIPFPDPEVLPWFVIKAKKEHEKATVKYERELQEYQQQQLLPVSPDQPPPKPPTPPRPMIQYKLIQPKQYPESIQHPHPAFRVSFMTSKKLVSKLAVDRNMVKKKMVAAVEAVFRGDPFLANDEDTFSTSTTSATKKSPPLARRGYEYLIFPTKEVMFMTQDQLMKLLIWELKNPKLYGGRPRPTENGTASNLSPSIGSNDEEERIRRLSSTEIKIRWKNNQPPKPELVPFWKHAAPHPLGRVQQSNAFLNRASPEAQQALAPLREKEGRRKKASMDRNSRRQRRNSKAFKSSIMCAAVGEGV